MEKNQEEIKEELREFSMGLAAQAKASGYACVILIMDKDSNNYAYSMEGRGAGYIADILKNLLGLMIKRLNQ